VNNYYRKFRKNAKALSPVVASIILIAVTVAVSVVVAAWMGGMTIGLMGNTEQVSVTNIQFVPGVAPAPDQIYALVQNSGGSQVAISTNAYINGVSATIANATLTIPKGSSATLVLNIPASLALANNAGTAYTVKMVTAKGTQVSSTQTYSP
jgi:flagellin-like protein